MDTNIKPENIIHVYTKCCWLETSNITQYLSLYLQLEYQITQPINMHLIVLRTGTLKNNTLLIMERHLLFVLISQKWFQIIELEFSFPLRISF